MSITKLKWAYRLLRSKHFVLLTDKAACIDLEGASPESLVDHQALLSQQSELRLFQSSLGRLLVEHRQAVDKKLGKVKSRGNHAKTNTPKRQLSKMSTTRKETVKVQPKAKQR